MSTRAIVSYIECGGSTDIDGEFELEIRVIFMRDASEGNECETKYIDAIISWDDTPTTARQKIKDAIISEAATYDIPYNLTSGNIKLVQDLL